MTSPWNFCGIFSNIGDSFNRVISHEPTQETAQVLHTFNGHAVVHVDADAGVLDVTDNIEDSVLTGVLDQLLLELESGRALLRSNSQDDIDAAAVSLVVEHLVVAI